MARRQGIVTWLGLGLGVGLGLVAWLGLGYGGRGRVRRHRHKHAVGEEYVEHLDAEVVPPVARLATTLDRRAHRLPAQGDQG